MIEYDDPEERAKELAKMIGIEDKVWLQVEDCERVYPIADEDLPRENATKTSSVHFLRYELSREMIASVHAGASISAGVSHPACSIDSVVLPAVVRDSLANDLKASVLN